MTDKEDLLHEVAYYARALMHTLRENYEEGDLDESVDEALSDLQFQLSQLDEIEDDD